MNEEDYLQLPEEKPYLEYVDGVVIQKPMPDAVHRKLAAYFTFLLFRYQLEHGGDSGPEGRVRLPDGSGFRLPDAAYWSPGRFSGDDSVPSLVVEVRSADQTLAELRRKCRTLRANGVACCWLIDPVSRTAEVFDGDRDGERIDADGALESDTMPGLRVELREVFAVTE